MQHMLLYFIGLPRPAPVTTATLPSNLKRDIVSLAAVINRAAKRFYLFAFSKLFFKRANRVFTTSCKNSGWGSPNIFFLMARLRVPLDISLFSDKTKSLEITIKQDITPEKVICGILKKCSVSIDPNQFELCIISGTKCN